MKDYDENLLKAAIERAIELYTENKKIVLSEDQQQIIFKAVKLRITNYKPSFKLIIPLFELVNENKKQNEPDEIEIVAASAMAIYDLLTLPF